MRSSESYGVSRGPFPDFLSPIDSLHDHDANHMNAGDIQSHLYRAFLEGRTADVSLHVRGSWEGVYKLHRVVLIQAGFFRSLFDSGFREAGGHNEVNVTFDDPNITRAAFEICISRLYGGGPALHVDPRLVPSRKEPLTSSFPKPTPAGKMPTDHHPATPRFLLSLLATATYLSIPSLVTQAILLVLKSIGPHTALRYLDFAIGRGIGERGDDDAEAAAGLEQVCQVVQTSRSSSLKTISSTTRTLGDLSIAEKEDPSDASAHFDEPEALMDGPAFLYGAASDKIGEAAACWLCRWGADMLQYEEATEHAPVPCDPAQQRAGPSRRRMTESYIAGPSGGALSMDVPVIWRRGGLSATWARVLLSSDAFFVRDERERYNLARRVVELRRRGSIDEGEEKEWDDLYTHGIRYMHMSLDDLIEISNDVSPTTNRPYASPAVIQSAHWDQSLLRHHITIRPSSSSSPTTPPRSPAPPRDKDLSLARTTTEITASFSGPQANGHINAQKYYYPVPGSDTSVRIGDTTGLDGVSMDQLFEGSPDKGKKPASRPSLSNFFGFQNEMRIASKCVETDSTGKARWSPFPPVRFGVEFWGVEGLKEKSRLHSHTIWYAGSLFNVYAQVVRKKGLQLGVYLHRQSSVDPIPVPSAPQQVLHTQQSISTLPSRPSTAPVSIPSSPSTPTLARPTSRGTTGVPSRSTTPTSSPGAGAMSYSPPAPLHFHGLHGLPTSLHVAPPAQPYRDPRPAVLAHFTIVCAAPTGSALTRFASAPDVFSVSQSWGWKSSSLQTEEFVGDGDSDGSSVPNMAREVSLRATVIVGLV